MAQYVFTTVDNHGNVVLYDESLPRENYYDFWQRCVKSRLENNCSGLRGEIEDLYHGEIVKQWNCD